VVPDNRALLRASAELASPALHIAIHELDDIPLYNGDAEAVGAPTAVVQLRIQFERIAQLQAEWDIVRLRSSRS
jgi:NAD(P)H-dependent FMN reductase